MLRSAKIFVKYYFKRVHFIPKVKTEGKRMNKYPQFPGHI